MTAPPQRWEPATCRLTCHGQAPGEAGWPPEALLEFTQLPQSEDNTAVREDALHSYRAFTGRYKRGHNSTIKVNMQYSDLNSYNYSLVMLVFLNPSLGLQK